MICNQRLKEEKHNKSLSVWEKYIMFDWYRWVYKIFEGSLIFLNKSIDSIASKRIKVCLKIQMPMNILKISGIIWTS